MNNPEKFARVDALLQVREGIAAAANGAREAPRSRPVPVQHASSLVRRA